MTTADFAVVMRFIEDALPTVPKLSKASANAYYDLLGDLPLPLLQAAAIKVLSEHEYNTFPAVAKLRRAAVEIMADIQNEDIRPSEAWQMARKISWQLDPNHTGSWCKNGVEYLSMWDAVTEGMPSVVLETVRRYGVRELCEGQDPPGVARAQFQKMFEDVVGKRDERAQLPAALKKQIAEVKRATLASPVAEAVKGIGRME